MPPTQPPETIVIEADTAEDALEQVTNTLGPNAEIVSAERVPTGGIGGFFARETVRITARERGGGVDLLPPPDKHPVDEAAKPGLSVDPDVSGIDAALDRMVNDANAGDMTFQEALQRQFNAPEHSAPAIPSDVAGRHRATDEVRPTPAVPAEAATTAPRAQPDVHPSMMPASIPSTSLRAAAQFRPTVTQPPTAPLAAAPGTGRVRWRISSLSRIGLPTSVMEAVVGLDPADDMAWVTAIANAVQPLCRPLPRGSTVIAGPQADLLSNALELETFRPPHLPPYGGSFVARVTDDPDDLNWLNHVLGDRRLHIVIGEHSWQGLVTDDPAAISWTSVRGVGAAVALASHTGAALGYGLEATSGTTPVRANPLDIAVSVRNLMERD